MQYCVPSWLQVPAPGPPSCPPLCTGTQPAQQAEQLQELSWLLLPAAPAPLLPLCLQEALARQRGVTPPALPPPESGPTELYRVVRRCHSRLQNVAGECWVYRRALPYALPAGAAAAAYVWRRELDPTTLQPLEGRG